MFKTGEYDLAVPRSPSLRSSSNMPAGQVRSPQHLGRQFSHTRLWRSHRRSDGVTEVPSRLHEISLGLWIGGHAGCRGDVFRTECLAGGPADNIRRTPRVRVAGTVRYRARQPRQGGTDGKVEPPEGISTGDKKVPHPSPC